MSARRRTGRRLMAALIASTLWAAPAAAQQSWVVVVSGLSGEPRFAESFATWSREVVDAARRSVPAGNIRVLAEDGTGANRSTRENVLSVLAFVGARAGADDDVLLVLFGHGSDEGGARINLPGPDLRAGDLAGALQAFRARRIMVVDATSASGAFVQPLAGRGRIVVAATKSGAERNETLFGGYFAAALAGDVADVDKDGRISLLEAFDYARHEVARAYDSAGRLQTEHAVLDGDGDGQGSSDPSATTADGAPASIAYLAIVPGAARLAGSGGLPGAAAGSGGATAAGDSAAAIAATPAGRELLERKRSLEAELAALRGRKAAMPEADYQRELERLLLELSRNGRALRRLEAGAR